MRILRLTGLGLLILIFFLARGPVEMTHLTSGGTLSPSILVYSDELEGEYLEDRPPLVALRNLGYSYTAVANNASFCSLLNTGGPWDLVLYNEELYDPSKSTYDALNIYLTSGGRAIITMWKMGAYSSNPLWKTLGVSYVDDFSFGDERTLYLWDSSHSIFTSPNAIPNPLTILDTESFGVDGIIVDVLSGATAVAGHTATPNDDEALIVVRDDGKTIFNGVLTGCMNLDQDGDGITEAVELWENEIKFIIKYTGAARASESIILVLVGVFVLWFTRASKFWAAVTLIIFVANFIGLFRILETAIFGVSAAVVYVWWNTSKQKEESARR